MTNLTTTTTTTNTTAVVVIQLGSVGAGAGAAPANGESSSPLVLKVTDMADAAKSTLLVEKAVDELEIIVESSELADIYKPMELATLVPYLRPEGVISVKVVHPGRTTGPAVDLQPVHTSFLLAGLKGVSEKREQDGSRVLTASLNPVKAASAPLRKTNAVVTIDLNAGGVGGGIEDDMIDEDDLLNSDLLAPPPAMNEIATASAGDDDCAGRKPCDNCTCGRADEADAAAGGGGGDASKKNAPSSSCGKCHLGDAFRCASCPYLGKPAFKPGEEHLVLQMTDDL